MPVGPFGPSPQLPAEMPNHSAVIVTCLGTVTVTRITRCSPGRTRYRGTWPSLRGGKDTPLMVGVNTTLGEDGGHDAPDGHRGAEEQAPTPRIPIASVATSPARRTVTLLGRTAARTGCSPQPAGVPFSASAGPRQGSRMVLACRWHQDGGVGELRGRAGGVFRKSLFACCEAG